jgi:RimJ/RimL family protein N-acetyltransferase
VSNPAPLRGLRVRTPRLELRLGTHDELVALGRLAEQGIHPPEEMPFAIAWTDAIGEPGFLEGFLAYHGGALADWSPASWTLNLLVWADGELAGTQGLLAESFAETRRVHTGSWLGAAYQRRGLGTEMRAAVLELAFRGLGAEVASSAWLEGNDASRRVAEKLGYRVVGMEERSPRGVPVPTTAVELARADWRCPVEVELEGVEPCLALFGADPARRARRASETP